MKKLENLICFEDFKTKAVKNINEDIEEIIPEGLPEDEPWDGSIGSEDPNSTDRFIPDYNSKGNSFEEKVEEITEFLDNEPDDDILEEVVNILRDGLTEMEQMGFVEPEVIDELDDLHDGDWAAWCKDVIELPDFFEEGLDNVLELIRNIETEEFGEIE